MKRQATRLLISLPLSMAVGLTGFSGKSPARSDVGSIPKSWQFPGQVSQFHPSPRSAPSVYTGDTVRCGCHEPEVTPLMPKDTDSDLTLSPYFAVTVVERPAFFWHVQKSQEQEVYFELREFEVGQENGEGTLIYEMSSTLPEFSGVVEMSLPPTVTLKVGKIYRWYLDFTCGSLESTTAEITWMSGWIERIHATPALRQQLTQARTPETRSRIYAEAGVWFDAIAILSRARRRADTPELTARWEMLLRSVDVPESIASAPLMDCCNEASTADSTAPTSFAPATGHPKCS